MSHRHLPASTSTLRVDVRGAEIVNEDEAHETSDIYLPKHTEFISHIALDIGGSLAKIVYFTRAANSSSSRKSFSKLPSSNEVLAGHDLTCQAQSSTTPASGQALGSSPPADIVGFADFSDEKVATLHDGYPPLSTRSSTSQPNGILTPALVREEAFNALGASSESSRSHDQHPKSSAASLQTNDKLRQGQSQEQISHNNTSPIDGQPLRKTHSLVRAPSVSSIPGGRLNFTKFETECIESECIPFITNLIDVSAKSNGVPISTMKRGVKIILTGGGAYMYFDRIRSALGGDVEVLREEEMDCLITGLNFLTAIPNEVFWFSDELVQEIVHNNPRNAKERQNMMTTSSKTTNAINSASSDPIILDDESAKNRNRLPSPGPNPPQYSVLFDSNATPQFPCMLVNIGSGVSIIKVSGFGKFERISGTSLGGGTLWGLLSLLTDAKSFDEMLDISMRGDNSTVDMLVGDIYGQDYEKIGLKSSVIASSFGKVFKRGSSRESQPKNRFSREDISKSLLYAISNNIGQIAHLNAEKHGLDRIYFGGCFIRGHVATVSTLSYAIRFWSKGTKRAFFLRHEGYLGSIGAWLKNISNENVTLDNQS